MSVINKMLRDLDARRVGGATPALSRQPGSAAMLGTASVGGPTGGRRIRPWLWAVLLLTMLAALAWYGRDALVAPIVFEEDKPAPVAAAPAPAVAASAPAQESVVAGLELVLPPELPAVPVAAAVTVDPDDSGARSAPTVQAEPAEPVVAAAAAPAATTATTAPVNQPLRAAAAKPARTERPAARSPGVSAPVVARREPTTPLAAPLQQRRQAAVQETLAQAQSLWQAGSREAALALMQEAVAVAERADRSDSRRDQMLSLAALARELARMELALGRPEAVLALLTRLEPALAEHGDLWAMRGNAAQRLARHEEAVRAYRSALQRRPDESRWLLGAAVSLAALGRLEEAAALAERARAQGAVSPEVLTYLRQSGVPLR